MPSTFAQLGYRQPWRRTVDIKQFLTRAQDVEAAHEAAGTVPREDEYHGAAAMRDVARVLAQHPEFDLVVGDVQAATDEEDVEAFDRALDRVYDVADRERIWLGL